MVPPCSRDVIRTTSWTFKTLDPINRKMECMIEICIFDVLFYTENENLNVKEQHIIHLFISLENSIYIKSSGLNVNQILHIL